MSRKLSICCVLALCASLSFAQQLQANNAKCLTCHSAPHFKKVQANGSETTLFVDAKGVEASVHSSISCTDCHTDLSDQKFPHKAAVDPVTCTRCHRIETGGGAPEYTHLKEFEDSVHGMAAKKGDPDAPSCSTCHGSHYIRRANDPKSQVYQTNIPETCGKCHFDQKFAERHGISSVKRYTDSVHAKVVRHERLEIASVCTDCHGVHDIQATVQIASSVNKPHVPATCGKCHKQHYKDYEKSVHGKALAEGEEDAPSCTDCHGEHMIEKPSASGSPVNPSHIAATCSKCHESMKIQDKFDLPKDRLGSFVDSYHGMASKHGDITVANCASCHGTHKILPSSDPESAISQKNLPDTCGKCHSGAGENFAKGSIHVNPAKDGDAIVYWVKTFYSLFVYSILASFAGYILLDLKARWTGKLPGRPGRGGHSR